MDVGRSCCGLGLGRNHFTKEPGLALSKAPAQACLQSQGTGTWAVSVPRAHLPRLGAACSLLLQHVLLLWLSL